MWLDRLPWINVNMHFFTFCTLIAMFNYYLFTDCTPEEFTKCMAEFCSESKCQKKTEDQCQLMTINDIINGSVSSDISDYRGSVDCDCIINNGNVTGHFYRVKQDHCLYFAYPCVVRLWIKFLTLPVCCQIHSVWMLSFLLYLYTVRSTIYGCCLSTPPVGRLPWDDTSDQWVPQHYGGPGPGCGHKMYHLQLSQSHISPGLW